MLLEAGLEGVVWDGSLLLAGPIALVAGLVSFFSPCVLPLVPSYFAYATGLSAGTVVGGAADRRRLVRGAALFCLGFGGVFVALGVGVRRLPGIGLGLAPVLGALFAATWLPCVGPVLGTILTLAYSSGSAARGGSLLAAYAVGLSIPFLLLALAWSRAMTAVRRLARHGLGLRRSAGAVMILIGVAMLTGWWTYAMQWLQVRTTGVSG